MKAKGVKFAGPVVDDKEIKVAHFAKWHNSAASCRSFAITEPGPYALQIRRAGLECDSYPVVRR
jgi:hypothetical protein